jgi:hypothetical protein
MRNRLILISILLLSASAFGQTTTITGTIKDLTNTVVSSGKVVFTLKPSVDTTISGNARFTPGAPITCYIQSNGTLLNAAQLAACTVTTNTSLTPAGTSYRVDICPYMACASSFNFYAINSSYDISTIVPTPTTGPAQNFADVFSNQTVAGNKTFTGQTTFGGVVLGSSIFTTFTAQSANGVLNAALFTGTGNGDIGDKVNQAYASCVTNGCQIRIPGNTACYSFSTPIVIGTNNQPATLVGDPAGSTCLSFTPTTGNAITIDTGTAHLGASGMRDITLVGPNSGTGNGVVIGPTHGVDQAVLWGVNIQKFGGDCFHDQGGFLLTVLVSQFSICNNGANFATTGQELIRIIGSSVFQNTNFGINAPINGVDLWISGTAMDDNIAGAINNGTSTIHVNGSHFENVGHTATSTYIVNTGGTVNITDSNMLDDITSGTNAEMIANAGGTLTCKGLDVFAAVGRTITQVVLASTSGATALTICQINNQSPTRILADINASYTSGSGITFPLNHTYSTVNWYNMPVFVGNSGVFSITTGTPGTLPLNLNCATGLACGVEFQQNAVQEVIAGIDTSDNFQLLNASTVAMLRVSQSGTVSMIASTFANLPGSPQAGMTQYCSDCQVTTAATCSTNTPASCVCKNSGNGAFAKYMNYQGNGNNWYCQ